MAYITEFQLYWPQVMAYIKELQLHRTQVMAYIKELQLYRPKEAKTRASSYGLHNRAATI